LSICQISKGLSATCPTCCLLFSNQKTSSGIRKYVICDSPTSSPPSPNIFYAILKRVLCHPQTCSMRFSNIFPAILKRVLGHSQTCSLPLSTICHSQTKSLPFQNLTSAILTHAIMPFQHKYNCSDNACHAGMYGPFANYNPVGTTIYCIDKPYKDYKYKSTHPTCTCSSYLDPDK
jgi:hypothetical protein